MDGSSQIFSIDTSSGTRQVEKKITRIAYITINATTIVAKIHHPLREIATPSLISTIKAGIVVHTIGMKRQLPMHPFTPITASSRCRFHSFLASASFAAFSLASLVLFSLSALSLSCFCLVSLSAHSLAALALASLSALSLASLVTLSLVCSCSSMVEINSYAS